MTQLDVKLLKGAPTGESERSEHEEGGARFRLGWSYGDSQSIGGVLIVLFNGDTRDDVEVSIVCERGGYSKLLGLGRFDTEEEVIEKLGPPSSESINSEGLRKLISYKRWNAAYEITRGSVQEVCVTASGKVRYADGVGARIGMGRQLPHPGVLSARPRPMPVCQAQTSCSGCCRRSAPRLPALSDDQHEAGRR